MNKKIILGILVIGILTIIASLFIFNHTKSNKLLNSDKLIDIDDIDDEEYNVYSALIRSTYGDNPNTLLVIVEDTTSPPEGGLSEISAKEVQQETVDNFKKANQQSYLLKRRFNPSINYILISQEELKNIFSRGLVRGWDKFHKKYPNSQGIITLSRVGFNNQKDQALVYIGDQFSSLSGAGSIILLIKENNVWKIKQRFMLWIS